MHRYTPFFCEENVWCLCQEQQFHNLEKKVIFISNEQFSCALWGQRASTAPHLPVFWDYHVILVCKDQSWKVWDLDTLIGMPVEVEDYLEYTFPKNKAYSKESAPLFRVIDSDEYIRDFSSDRSHMIGRNGRWLAPRPPWPPIMRGGESNLMSYIDMRNHTTGTIIDLPKFRSCFTNSESYT